MDRKQSIISFVAVLIVYVLSHAGFVIDMETSMVIASFVVGLAFVIWGCWKNHNVTEAALWMQRQLNEIKAMKDKVSLR